MLSFPGAGRDWGNNRVPILASFFFNFNFFRFFNFLSFFKFSILWLRRVHVYCWVFSFFISKYWKKYMYVISTPILLPPFAGCQSAFSQNHSQNVNEVLLT